MELPDTFVEVYDFYYVPFWQTRWFIASVSIGAVLGTSLIGYFFYRWYKKRVSLKKPELAHEWAYAQLMHIKPDGQVSLAQLPNYYLSLTYILKNYIEKRYSWKIVHKTDQELIEFFNISSLTDEHKKLLPMLLSRAQEIKFAPETVTKFAADDWQDIYEFVAQTKIAGNEAT